MHDGVHRADCGTDRRGPVRGAPAGRAYNGVRIVTGCDAVQENIHVEVLAVTVRTQLPGGSEPREESLPGAAEVRAWVAGLPVARVPGADDAPGAVRAELVSATVRVRLPGQAEPREEVLAVCEDVRDWLVGEDVVWAAGAVAPGAAEPSGEGAGPGAPGTGEDVVWAPGAAAPGAAEPSGEGAGPGAPGAAPFDPPEPWPAGAGDEAPPAPRPFEPSAFADGADGREEPRPIAE